MTVAAAAYSRQFFGKLVAGLSRHRSGDVADVTKKVLNRACTDLGAILASIPTASAMPAVPRVSVKLVRTKVPTGLSPKVDVKITDSRGRPMDGVEFRVDWPGTRYDSRLYSLPNGVKRTHGAASWARGKQQVRVTVLNPAGATTASIASSSSARVTRLHHRLEVVQGDDEEPARQGTQEGQAGRKALAAVAVRAARATWPWPCRPWTAPR